MRICAVYGKTGRIVLWKSYRDPRISRTGVIDARRFGARTNRVDNVRVSPMAILKDSDTRVLVQLEVGPAGAAGSRTLRIADTGAPARRGHDFISAMRRVEEEVYGTV